VGEVLGWDIGNMAESATIHVFVREPFDKYVNDQTRFWDASGLSVKLGGNGVEVQVESLRAIVLGGIAFDTLSGSAVGQESDKDHVFPLFANKDAAQAASYSRSIPFVAYFPGSVRGLAAGADVTLHGLKVGQVTGVQLTYDAAKDAITAPVNFDVEPERFLGIGHQVFKDAATGVGVMVGKGLRATLQSANLLTGQMLVALEFDHDAPPAQVTKEDGVFVMPTVESGGFSGLEAAATDLLRKVNAIPFDAIGRSVAQLTKASTDLINGPELKRVLTSLDATLGSVKDTVQKIDAGMGPVMRKLPDMATGLQKTMTDTNRLILSLQTGYGDNTQFNRDLERLLVQLNDATRSIRALADLLARHPEALIKGRPAGGVE
jgi:paraquat-inducible protein B